MRRNIVALTPPSNCPYIIRRDYGYPDQGARIIGLRAAVWARNLRPLRTVPMFNQRFLDRIPVDNLSTSAHGPQIVVGNTVHAVQYSIVIVGGPDNAPTQ